MAAAAARGAKRSLRAELKQRLQAMSAEERLRQSRLLTEKVQDHGDHLRSGLPPALAGGAAQARCLGALVPRRAHVLSESGARRGRRGLRAGGAGLAAGGPVGEARLPRAMR